MQLLVVCHVVQHKTEYSMEQINVIAIQVTISILLLYAKNATPHVPHVHPTQLVYRVHLQPKLSTQQLQCVSVQQRQHGILPHKPVQLAIILAKHAH